MTVDVITLQRERVIYLLKDTPATRKLIHRHIEVYEYPDGRIELRADGVNLAYVRYDRLPQVHAAAIVENKRLSRAVGCSGHPGPARRSEEVEHASRTNQGQAPYPKKKLQGTKRSRQFTSEDLELAV